MKKGVRAGLVLHAITTTLLSTLLYFGGGLVISMFNHEANVINIGMQIMRFLCPTWITFIFVEILSATIRACGNSLTPMVITGVGICGLRVAYLIVHQSSTVLEALFCYPVSWIITSIIFIIYYLQGSWLKKSLQKRQELLQQNQ